MKRRFYTSLSSFTDFDAVDIQDFTDPVSNAVFLEDISPLSNAAKLESGTLDSTYLPSFLHEATHHATFDCQVGVALASLVPSCFSFWWEQVASNVPGLAVRDLAMLRVAVTLFEPLSEGLALFVEHDLIMGSSPVMSNMSRNACLLFAKGRTLELLGADPEDLLKRLAQGEGPSLISSAYTDLLKSVRTRPEWVNRKRKLLEQPLVGPHRYLLGYLAVKGMYKTLSDACPPLKDPEAFVLVVIKHLFGNEKLVRILLHPLPKTDDPLEAYVHINADIQELLNTFQDLVDELYRYPNRVAMGVLEPLLQNSGLRSLYAKGRRIEEDGMLAPDLQLLAGLRAVGMINIAWPRLLKHRSDFRFSFQAVTVTVGHAGEITITDPVDGKNIPVNAKAVEKARRGRFLGSIEAFVLRDSSVVVCVLAIDGLVAVLDCSTGVWNSDNLVEHLDDVPSATAVEGAMHAFKKYQDQVFEKDGVREVIQGLRDDTAEGLELIYPQLIFYRRPREERSFLVRGLQNGIAGALGDPAKLELVASLSLLIGIGAECEVVQKSLGMNKEEWRSQIDEINRISVSACGLQIFSEVDGMVYSAV
jgi:hypothetical protein